MLTKVLMGLFVLEIGMVFAYLQWRLCHLKQTEMGLMLPVASLVHAIVRLIVSLIDGRNLKLVLIAFCLRNILTLLTGFIYLWVAKRRTNCGK